MHACGPHLALLSGRGAGLVAVLVVAGLLLLLLDDEALLLQPLQLLGRWHRRLQLHVRPRLPHLCERVAQSNDCLSRVVPFLF